MQSRCLLPFISLILGVYRSNAPSCSWWKRGQAVNGLCGLLLHLGVRPVGFVSPGFDLRVDQWRLFLDLLQVRDVLPVSPSRLGRTVSGSRLTRIGLVNSLTNPFRQRWK